MAGKKQSSSQDIGEALNRWEIGNVEEMSVGTIKIQDGVVVTKREVDEYKDGAKTGKKINIYLFQIEIDNIVKEAKFGKQSIAACAKQWGTDAGKWAGKKVVAVFDKVGSNQYIIWKPAGKLDSS